MMILLLVIIVLLCIITCREPREFVDMKNRYTVFLTKIKDSDKYPMLKKRSIVTGFRKRIAKSIGYNVNKGNEIGVCVDGTANEMFHVLLHELAHTTVKEYDHSEKFWNNFNDLRSMCKDWGIYTEIPHKTSFCGKYIRD